MEPDIDIERVSNEQREGKRWECTTCLYRAWDETGLEKEKCLRFARFVDHVLTEKSRDCEYWRPARQGFFPQPA